MWGEGGLYKQVCGSGEFLGRDGERKREREGERVGKGKCEGAGGHRGAGPKISLLHLFGF